MDDAAKKLVLDTLRGELNKLAASIAEAGVEPRDIVSHLSSAALDYAHSLGLFEQEAATADVMGRIVEAHMECDGDKCLITGGCGRCIAEAWLKEYSA